MPHTHGSQEMILELDTGHKLTLTEQRDTTHAPNHALSYHEPVKSNFPRVQFAELPAAVQENCLAAIKQEHNDRMRLRKAYEAHESPLGIFDNLSIAEANSRTLMLIKEDPNAFDPDRLFVNGESELDVVPTGEYSGPDSFQNATMKMLQIGMPLQVRFHAFVDMVRNDKLTCTVGTITRATPA